MESGWRVIVLLDVSPINFQIVHLLLHLIHAFTRGRRPQRNAQQLPTTVNSRPPSNFLSVNMMMFDVDVLHATT
jgi:hypothetical protein